MDEVKVRLKKTKQSSEEESLHAKDKESGSSQFVEVRFTSHLNLSVSARLILIMLKDLRHTES